MTNPEPVRPTDPGPAELTAEMQLPLGPGAARIARGMTRSVLSGWQVLDSDLIHDATLVASELVTNAITHGGDSVVLELQLDHDVVVAVRDGIAVLPRPKLVDELDESGRGLTIVAAVALGWGTESTADGGKRVWVRLQDPRSR